LQSDSGEKSFFFRSIHSTLRGDSPKIDDTRRLTKAICHSIFNFLYFLQRIDLYHSIRLQLANAGSFKTLEDKQLENFLLKQINDFSSSLRWVDPYLSPLYLSPNLSTDCLLFQPLIGIKLMSPCRLDFNTHSQQERLANGFTSESVTLFFECSFDTRELNSLLTLN
jgi:hypothetical protein